MSLVTLLAFFVVAAVNWTAVADDRKEDRTVEWVAKPAALVLLVLYAATGADPSFWLMAALGFGLLGDVYLMLPGNLFVAGLLAFLIGHLCYIVDFEAGFWSRLLCFAVVVGATWPVSSRIVGSIKEASLRPGVIGYIAVISFMLASALASGSVLASLGALLFFASDGVLAWNRFVQPIPRAHLYVMVTYHLGQLGLATALRCG
jgi:uncharacterized membrane protein YhhN